MTQMAQSRPLRAAVLMTVGVMLFAPLPLIPQLWGVSVLWAAALVETGSGLAVLAGVAATTARRRGWWRAVGRRLRSGDFLACLLGRATTLSVIFAAPLAGATLAAALLALSPASWALVLGSVRDEQHHRRFAAPGTDRWVALMAACGGCVLLAFAQPLEIRSAGWKFAAGIAMCATAAVCEGFAARGLAVGTRIADDVDAAHHIRFEAAGACAAYAIAQLCSALILTVVAWLAAPAVPSMSTAVVVAVAGIVMVGAAAAAIRMAVLYAPSSGVVAILSAIPVFTAAAAAALGILGGVNAGLLILAVVLVAAGGGWAATSPTGAGVA